MEEDNYQGLHFREKAERWESVVDDVLKRYKEWGIWNSSQNPDEMKRYGDMTAAVPKIFGPLNK